jgi:hypothetical protein
VPPLLLIVWNGVVVPSVLYRLALLEGSALTLSGLERRMAHWWFYYVLFSAFLGALLGT